MREFNPFALHTFKNWKNFPPIDSDWPSNFSFSIPNRCKIHSFSKHSPLPFQLNQLSTTPLIPFLDHTWSNFQTDLPYSTTFIHPIYACEKEIHPSLIVYLTGDFYYSYNLYHNLVVRNDLTFYELRYFIYSNSIEPLPILFNQLYLTLFQFVLITPPLVEKSLDQFQNVYLGFTITLIREKKLYPFIYFHKELKRFNPFHYSLTTPSFESFSVRKKEKEFEKSIKEFLKEDKEIKWGECYETKEDDIATTIISFLIPLKPNRLKKE